MKSHHTINVTNDSSVDDNIEFNLIDNEGLLTKYFVVQCTVI